MNNKYNVMITYSGEGTFTFSLRKIGTVEISAGRPIYIYNADVDTINNLRILKRMLINIAIGVKPTGAFRVFNMDDYEIPQNVQVRGHVAANYKEPISNNEIASILKGGSTPEVATTVIKDETKKSEEKPKKSAAKKTAAKTTKTTKKK